MVKPDSISHEQAAASLLSGLNAYNAFFYKLHLEPKEFLVLLPGHCVSIPKYVGHDVVLPSQCSCLPLFLPVQSVDTVAIQLAGSMGVKVIVAAATTEELNLYGDCGAHVGKDICGYWRIISSLTSLCFSH